MMCLAGKPVIDQIRGGGGGEQDARRAAILNF
jgi:hypothetical protein